MTEWEQFTTETGSEDYDEFMAWSERRAQEAFQADRDARAERRFYSNGRTPMQRFWDDARRCREASEADA